MLAAYLYPCRRLPTITSPGLTPVSRSAAPASQSVKSVSRLQPRARSSSPAQLGPSFFFLAFFHFSSPSCPIRKGNFRRRLSQSDGIAARQDALLFIAPPLCNDSHTLLYPHLQVYLRPTHSQGPLTTLLLCPLFLIHTYSSSLSLISSEISHPLQFLFSPSLFCLV